MVGRNNSDCNASNLPDLDDANVAVGTSSRVISADGDFAFGNDINLRAGNVANNCLNNVPGAPKYPQKDGKADKAGPATFAVTWGARYLCVTVRADNAERIPEGQYMGDVTFGATDLARPFPPMGAEDLVLGEIKHDGTTVNIPFLTSYDGYVQRLVIVNRNKQDVAYTLTFHTEGDGTADPGMVEGMLDGGQTTVIKVADEVTFTSPTRGSGTLDIVSTSAMVDVATTMVNETDQSTNTVVLHLGNRDDNNM